jgi:hypothetical protein
MRTRKKKKSISKRKIFRENELEKKIENFLSRKKHQNHSKSHGSKKMNQTCSRIIQSLIQQKHIAMARSFFELEAKKISIRYSFSFLRQLFFKAFSKKTRYTALAILLVLVVSSIAYYRKYIASAATYTWIQSSWSGGASTGAPFPVHPTNQSDWNKYYSKSGIDTTSGITLERISN